MIARHTTREVVRYLTVTLGLATVLAITLPGTDVDNPGPIQILTMMVPLVAVAFVAGSTRAAAPWRRMGWRPAVWSWVPAVMIPAAVMLPAYALADAVGWCDLDDLGGYLARAPLMIALLTVLVLGEEVGWRGFLLPRLQQLTTSRRGAVLTGLLHGLFHVPLLTLTYGYDSDGSRWIIVPGVVAVIAAGGVTYGWLRDRSGSLWPVAIAHASTNAFLLRATDVAQTDHPERLAYLTGEGGLLTLLVAGTVAAILLRRPWPGEARTSTPDLTPLAEPGAV